MIIDLISCIKNSNFEGKWNLKYLKDISISPKKSIKNLIKIMVLKIYFLKNIIINHINWLHGVEHYSIFLSYFMQFRYKLELFIV